MAKQFGNTPGKVKAILSVFDIKERLNGRQITERLIQRGYKVKEGEINMFVYHYMLYKHLDKERVDRVNYYSPI